MDDAKYAEFLGILGKHTFRNWHPLMKQGKPLLDRLIADLEVFPSRLTDRQLANVMLASFRLRCWGSTQKLIEALGRHIESSSINIRSEAAKYLVGFVKLRRTPSHKNEVFDVHMIPPLLLRAKSLGLKKPIADLIDTEI